MTKEMSTRDPSTTVNKMGTYAYILIVNVTLYISFSGHGVPGPHPHLPICNFMNPVMGNRP